MVFKQGYGIVKYNTHNGVIHYAYGIPEQIVTVAIRPSTLCLIQRVSDVTVIVRDADSQNQRSQKWLLIIGLPHQVQKAISSINRIAKSYTFSNISREQVVKFHESIGAKNPPLSVSNSIPSTPIRANFLS